MAGAPTATWDSSLLSDVLRSRVYLGMLAYTPDAAKVPGKQSASLAILLEISHNGHVKHGPSSSNPGPLKALAFNEAAKRDLLDLPAEVVRTFGHHLFEVQRGLMPNIAKVLKGFGGADVLELRLSDPAGTYRAVYTVRFSDRIYVLHAFQKKSHKGISTDKHDIELIKARLKWAEAEDARWRAGQRGEP